MIYYSILTHTHSTFRVDDCKVKGTHWNVSSFISLFRTGNPLVTQNEANSVFNVLLQTFLYVYTMHACARAHLLKLARTHALTHALTHENTHAAAHFPCFCFSSIAASICQGFNPLNQNIITYIFSIQICTFYCKYHSFFFQFLYARWFHKLFFPFN